MALFVVMKLSHSNMTGKFDPNKIYARDLSMKTLVRCQKSYLIKTIGYRSQTTAYSKHCPKFRNNYLIWIIDAFNCWIILAVITVLIITIHYIVIWKLVWIRYIISSYTILLQHITIWVLTGILLYSFKVNISYNSYNLDDFFRLRHKTGLIHMIIQNRQPQHYFCSICPDD